MDTELRNNIAELLMQTGHAHHKAFEATDGASQMYIPKYRNPGSRSH